MFENPIFNTGYEVILASGSPRRQELLRSLDIPFTLDVRPVDETFPRDMKASEIAEYLADKKSVQWGDLDDHQILITADTVVSVNDQILEKPANESEAEQMLTRLSGRTHWVFTGVCLRTNKQKVHFTDRTDVTFRDLDQAEIGYYISKYKPFDKAGGYGAQEWMGMVAISELKGSYFNVMGLPVDRVYSALRNILNRH